MAQYVQKGTFAFVDGLSRPPQAAIGMAAAAAGIKSVVAGITAAVRRVSSADGGGGGGGGPLLVLENPDFLLAATEGVGALDMADMVFDLREVCSSDGAVRGRAR